MARLRQNLLKGTIDNAPLAVGDLELESDELADMQEVVAPDIMALTLDPGAGASSEIVHVTAHAAAATTATIVRGQEDSTASEHAAGVGWLHGPTKADIEEGGSGEILAIVRYQGAVDTNYHNTGGALVDVDAANVFVTFDAPASGNVLVNVAAYGQGDPKVSLGLREGAVDVIGPQVCTTDNGMLSRSFYVTGLAAGSHTLKLAFFGGYIFYGPTEGAVEMTVLSAP